MSMEDEGITPLDMAIVDFQSDIIMGIHDAKNEDYNSNYGGYPGYQLGYDWMVQQIAEFKLKYLIEGEK